MNRLVNITEKLAKDLKRLAAEGQAKHVPPIEPLNCLLVEDDKDDAFLAQRALKAMGADVTWVRGGNEAIKALHDTKHPDVCNFHVVFLDMVLPGGPSGLDVLKFIREHFPDLHVVIVSGMGDNPAYLEPARRFGYYGVITKPLTQGDVKEIIEKHHL